MSQRSLKLIAIGLDSALVSKIIANGLSISKLRHASQSELARTFSDTEIASIVNAMKRKPISASTIEKLIAASDWKCCLCWNWDNEDPVILHHIDEHSRTHDDSYENLVVLCLKHHAVAHSKWEISRHPYPPEVIRQRKQDWENAIREYKAGIRPRPGNEPQQKCQIPKSPSPPNQYVNRLDIQDRIISALAKSSARIALFGIPGGGKTSLAKQLAWALDAEYPGGVFWVDLAEFNGAPAPILHSWITLCSNSASYERDMGSLISITRAVFDQHSRDCGSFAVIIDDIREEWLECAKALVLALPDKTPLIITTRHATIASSICTHVIEVDGMSINEATDMLYRTADPLGDFADSDAVDDLLSTVGYLPLAIELAGKCIQFFSRKPDFTLRNFQRRVAEKASENLSLPGHPGLAATFAISYDALLPQNSYVFRAMAAFANTEIDLPAISYTLNIASIELESVLDQLVASSMIKWGNHPNRYKLHPLLWQYANTLLRQDNDNDNIVRDRHMSFYLDICHDNSIDDKLNHDRIEASLSNIFAACNYAKETGKHAQLSTFARLLWSEGSFLQTRSYYTDALPLLVNAVSACRQLGDYTNEGVHLTALATVQNILGDIGSAKVSLLRAIEISRQLDRPDNECAQLGNLGTLLQDQGKTGEALDCYHNAISIAAQHQNVDVIRDVTAHLGAVYRHLGDRRTARKHYETALQMSRLTNNRLSEGNSMSNLGLTYYDDGDLDTAEELILAALAIANEIGDRTGEANRIGHLGNIHHLRVSKAVSLEQYQQASDELAKAFKCYEKAYTISQAIGHRSHEAAWLGNMGNIWRSISCYDNAINCYSAAIKLSEEIDSLEQQGLFLYNLGMTYQTMGDIDNSISALTKAEEIMETTGSRDLDKVRSVILMIQKSNPSSGGTV